MRPGLQPWVCLLYLVNKLALLSVEFASVADTDITETAVSSTSDPTQKIATHAKPSMTPMIIMMIVSLITVGGIGILIVIQRCLVWKLLFVSGMTRP